MQSSSGPLIIYQSPSNMDHSFLMIEVIKQSSPKKQIAFINAAENRAFYNLILLKTGIKFSNYIDVFGKGMKFQQEELPLTEETSKLWYQQEEEVIIDVSAYIKNKLSAMKPVPDIIMIDDLYYLNVVLGSGGTMDLLKWVRTTFEAELHIYSPNSCKLGNILRKHGSKVVSLVGNPSGYSKDIDGQMVVESRVPMIKQERVIYQVEGQQLKLLSALQIVS